MSKIIDSLVQASLDSKDFAGLLLARFHFDSPIGTLRFTNAQQSIYWDEEGTGEVEYIGLGNLAQVNPVPETSELSNSSMGFSLSGIPNNTITGIFDKSLYQNKPCYLWYGTLDKETFAVQGGQTGPILIFAGLMDFATFSFGQNAAINLVATSRLADWERPRGGRFNESYQRTYVDPTDNGFRYVKPLQSKEIRWAGQSAADPGGGDWANSGTEPGSAPGPQPSGPAGDPVPGGQLLQ